MTTSSWRRRRRSRSRLWPMAATPAGAWRRPMRSSRSPRARNGRSSICAPRSGRGDGVATYPAARRRRRVARPIMSPPCSPASPTATPPRHDAWTSGSAAGRSRPWPGRSNGSPSAPASTCASRSFASGGAARTEPDPDPRRRDAAAHPGPGRRQPLPLGPRRGRPARIGRGLYPRAEHAAAGPRRDRLGRPVRHHHRASPRRHRRDRDRADCSMPGWSAPAGAACSSCSGTMPTARRQWFEASGIGRQTGGGMVQPVSGPDHLQLRPQDASDPRLCADAPRPRLPRRLRLADRRGGRRRRGARGLGRRLWQPGPAQPCRRPRHLLFAYEPDRGRAGRRGCGRVR